MTRTKCAECGSDDGVQRSCFGDRALVCGDCEGDREEHVRLSAHKAASEAARIAALEAAPGDAGRSYREAYGEEYPWAYREAAS